MRRFLKSTYHHYLGSEHQKIDAALEHYLEMDAATRGVVIDDIFKTGELRVFGYGSLILDPHIAPDLQYAGTVQGFRRDAIFTDRHYRGTPDRLGITMGIIPASGEQLNGVVLVVSKIEKGKGFADRVIESIQALAKRETSYNPIYKYEVVDVESAHGTVKAIICGTDQSNPAYLGLTVENHNLEFMTFDEKARVICQCKGIPGASVRNTGLAYWMFILDCAYKTGHEPEPHIKKLVSRALAFRRTLDGNLRAELEKLEDIPERAHFDPRVFEVDETTNVHPAHLLDLIGMALIKMPFNDPLPRKDYMKVRSLMRELGAKSAAASPMPSRRPTAKVKVFHGGICGQ